MNFSPSEFLLGGQRARQWVPLMSQQFRLRHVYQIIAFNLHSETTGSYYYTLHLTTMCAPFYTSEQINSPNPKWPELDLKDISNTSTSCIVIRIWQCCCDDADKIILTWGVHFSGLVYIGNKIAEVQPLYFKNNTVIFYMQGGYYTSHHLIDTDLQKPIPFLNNVNLIGTLNGKVIYRRVAMKVNKSEIQNSYKLEKLRRLHSLQLEIKKRTVEVQNIKDTIMMHSCSDSNEENESSLCKSVSSSYCANIRYAPQLLTMTSLNRMLQEKPTKFEKQEMQRVNKEIELVKFRTRILSQEKDKKNVIIRQLKQKLNVLIEENEEREFTLMENYRLLSREAERLKESKKLLLQHREVYSTIYFQLQQRRRKLLQELLFIYPIEKHGENKFTINGIYLPKSDILADCSDTGLSVALGYVTHVLVMCSIFLQVPLRYPLTHYGSKSYITDNVSPLLQDKERDFPLYTKGKDKGQFTYAVYLLNKNIAQMRWLYYMNTNDLKATLPNLLGFLQGQKELRLESLAPMNVSTSSKQPSPSQSDRYVSSHSFGSISNISDAILDSVRHESQRFSSPTRRTSRKFISKQSRSSECGKGLSEILAIPEAFLNKQISPDSFRNYIVSTKDGSGTSKDGSCCESSITTENSISSIKITNGKEIDMSYDANSRTTNETLIHQESIEQGTDPLDLTADLSAVITKSIDIHRDSQLDKRIINEMSITQNKRISRSMGSYTDDESSLVLRTNFELGSEPHLLNVLEDLNLKGNEKESTLKSNSVQEGQQDLLEKWLENTQNLICTDENLYPEEYLGTSSGHVSRSNPLMARTDALLSTKSFNLVKPKP